MMAIVETVAIVFASIFIIGFIALFFASLALRLTRNGWE